MVNIHPTHLRKLCCELRTAPHRWAERAFRTIHAPCITPIATRVKLAATRHGTHAATTLATDSDALVSANRAKTISFYGHLREILRRDAVEKDAVVREDAVRVQAEHESFFARHLGRLQSRVEVNLRACVACGEWNSGGN